MTKIEHRNIVMKRLCATCDHAHFPNDDAVAAGWCLERPPAALLLGMAQQQNVIQKPEHQPMIPIVRGAFPLVQRTDTCSRWTRKTEGEA